ncbi:hypothetical protein [Streptomyces sp. NPDC052036]
MRAVLPHHAGPIHRQYGEGEPSVPLQKAVIAASSAWRPSNSSASNSKIS